MATDSSIQWTTHTFNGWIGCERVSEGCKYCYAAVSTPARTSRAEGLELWGPAPDTKRKKTSADNWALPKRWDRAAQRSGERTFVFASSLCDVFEDHPEVAPWRAELFALIDATPSLTWQLLTKRPENIRRFLPASWLEQPRAHVWFGTTVENQKMANERIPELMLVSGPVRFLSCEPLLESIDLRTVQEEGWCPKCDDRLFYDAFRATARCRCCVEASEPVDLERIDWVIVGGESGPSARRFDLAWAYELIEQCRAAEVPVFVKQLGSRPIGEPRSKTPRRWMTQHHPSLRDVWMLNDSHGGDASEWPSDLCVREMPACPNTRPRGGV